MILKSSSALTFIWFWDSCMGHVLTYITPCFIQVFKNHQNGMTQVVPYDSGRKPAVVHHVWIGDAVLHHVLVPSIVSVFQKIGMPFSMFLQPWFQIFVYVFKHQLPCVYFFFLIHSLLSFGLSMIYYNAD